MYMCEPTHTVGRQGRGCKGGLRQAALVPGASLNSGAHWPSTASISLSLVTICCCGHNNYYVWLHLTLGHAYMQLARQSSS